MIDTVQSVQTVTGRPCAAVCRALDVNYGSLMRWKRRRAAGKDIVQRPGPGKTGPLDLHALTARIRDLAHGQERTRGTGALYAENRDVISRRDLHALVADVRNEVHRAEQALTRRIEWLRACLVWAVDDIKFWLGDRLVHLNVVHDLGSRYTLCVLAGEALADGPTLARNFRGLFDRYGRPLFVKRDNGSNLNHGAVDDLFGEDGIIPLNSPRRYPPYNGGMEHKQGEIKKQFLARLPVNPAPWPQLRLAAELAGHDLNHLPRPILDDRTACQVFCAGRPALAQYNRRKRKEVFEAITMLAVDIEARLEQHNDTGAQAAFRYAAESWMQSDNIIRVHRDGQVLPPSYRLRWH
jgi:hypothetical protein